MSLEQGEGSCGDTLMQFVTPTHGMNSGLWLVRPSAGLWHTVLERLTRPGCLTPEWYWTDQELLICLGAEGSIPIKACEGAGCFEPIIGKCGARRDQTNSRSERSTRDQTQVRPERFRRRLSTRGGVFACVRTSL